MPHLISFAKNLRTNCTDAERVLWQHLRGHRFLDFKFKRQKPIGKYIVDFVCFRLRLVIEIDGSQHLESKYDLQRDQWLNNQGFKILRFWNNEIFENLAGVLNKIYAEVETPSP